MPLTEKKAASNRKFDLKTYDTILLKVRKDSHVKTMLQSAVSLGKGKSVNDYMIQAIKEKLEKDDIPFPESDQATSTKA